MIVAGVLLVVVLIGFAAFLAASETSLTAMNKLRVRRLIDERVRGARTLDRLLDQPNRFLTVILLLTLLAHLSATSLASYVAEAFFAAELGTGLVATLTTLVMTIVIFIVAEVTPKAFSIQNPERVATGVAKAVSALTSLFFPITRIFVSISNLFVRILGGKVTGEGPFVTEEEIKSIVAFGAEEAVIEEEEKDMIHSIIAFGDTVVREVMVPRTDMAALEIDVSAEDALKMFETTGHSRIPMYAKSLDNVVGMLYAKDLLIAMARARPDKVVKPRTLARKVHFVPEIKKVSELLREMRKEKTHIAIVVDEYGGTAGLVTIEDLLEEIVGEIFDEYDQAEPMIEQVEENKVRVNARLSLDEINEELGLDLVDPGVDSIGGFVIDLAGRIPRVGEMLEYDNLRLTVEKVGRRRIAKVLIEKLPRPEAEQQEE
ncbi:MAG: HlyC/CorC family transporter [Actinobacteria bacterium]|nr:MAG: HlyC/CorC family transporter [Actinomycetota bacterium]